MQFFISFLEKKTVWNKNIKIHYLHKIKAERFSLSTSFQLS